MTHTSTGTGTTPVFAVVGRPNKGKSSIVATLARDDSVRIDAHAGSTRQARRFPMQIDGQTLYELVDTPGIQRARAVLDWLVAHCSDAASRAAAVQRFVKEHARDPVYVNEIQMLEPIVEGAGIIYVVDGSCPFAADYEAEMEILRWTGRPSLAVINPIDSDDFVQEWTAGLGQYFQTVRTFNAHRAEFEKQLDLLALFGHLDPHWRAPLERAVTVLREDREMQHRAASYLITDLIVEALQYRVEQSVPDGVPLHPIKQTLFALYKKNLVRAEGRCRRQVEELFHHRALHTAESQLIFDDADLFNVADWYLWGLNKRQLVSVASVAGGLAGGSAGMVLDAATGGLLGGLGTLVSGLGGAATSAGGAWLYAEQIARIKVKGLPSGGQLVTYGPSRNLNFPFVLLGRALQHHRLVSARSHATRDVLKLGEPVLAWLTDADRKQLARLFGDISADKKRQERRCELAAKVLHWCLQVDRG